MGAVRVKQRGGCKAAARRVESKAEGGWGLGQRRGVESEAEGGGE